MSASSIIPARSTTFVLTGPNKPAADQDETNLPDHGTLVGMSQNPLRVVIAEDEALIRLDLKEMLEEEGYSVVAEAGGGGAARGHVSTPRPGPGLPAIQKPGPDRNSAAAPSRPPPGRPGG